MHLITGGSGYFGELLARCILSKNKKVKIFDINQPSEFLSRKAEVILGDIRDNDSVHDALENVTHVHHNVAQVPLAKDKDLFKSVNYEGTSNLLRSAYERKISKIVYTSSSAVFGIPLTNPVTENTIPRPREEYGKAKYDGELVCKEYIEKGLDITIVRPRTILGHGRLGIFSILFDLVKEGNNIPVLDNGQNVFQFIHADDLAEICWLASQKKGPSVYNAGAIDYCTMRDTLESLCKYANTGSRVKSLPMNLMETLMNVFSFLGLSPLGKYHALMFGRSMYFDNEKVIRELGYRTKYSNKDAICSSYSWFLDNDLGSETTADLSHHQKKANKKIFRLLRFFI